MTTSDTSRQAISRELVEGPRTAMQRLLVVGDKAIEKLARELLLEADVQMAIQFAEDFLMALGQMAVEPPTAVIGRTQDLSGSVEATAAALRRVTPAARLILVARPEEEPDAIRAVIAGFDDYVLDPLDPDELMAVLEGRPRASAVLRQESQPAPPVVPERPEPSAPIEASCDELGDVDLVEQVLRDPAGLRELAMRIIAGRSAVAGASWAETAAQVPAGHAVVPVEFQGGKHGFLYAPAPAGTVQLGAWAAWLARWLALEKHMRDQADLALRDELTGVWNRRYFNQFFNRIMGRAAQERFRVTLLLFDIDDFKIYNDRYGHGAGDEILREAAKLMQSVVRTHDVVARIGGDEFAVIFWDAEGPRQPNSQHPQSVLDAARRFQRAICQHRFPKLLDEAPGTLTISGGLASFPWDARSPEELMSLADERALQSKRQGKNAITFGPGAEQRCAILPDK